ASRTGLHGGDGEHRRRGAPRGHRERVLLDDLGAGRRRLLLRRGFGRRRAARGVRGGPPRRGGRHAHRHGVGPGVRERHARIGGAHVAHRGRPGRRPTAHLLLPGRLRPAHRRRGRRGGRTAHLAVPPVGGGGAAVVPARGPRRAARVRTPPGPPRDRTAAGDRARRRDRARPQRPPPAV